MTWNYTTTPRVSSADPLLCIPLGESRHLIIPASGLQAVIDAPEGTTVICTVRDLDGQEVPVRYKSDIPAQQIFANMHVKEL